MAEPGYGFTLFGPACTAGGSHRIVFRILPVCTRFMLRAGNGTKVNARTATTGVEARAWWLSCRAVVPARQRRIHGVDTHRICVYPCGKGQWRSGSDSR